MQVHGGGAGGGDEHGGLAVEGERARASIALPDQKLACPAELSSALTSTAGPESGPVQDGGAAFPSLHPVQGL